jgi:alkylated DNA nucleotide flippase Atl1
MKKLRQIIREEIKSLQEGHDGTYGEITDRKGNPVTSREQAMQVLQGMVGDNEDLSRFRGAKWVGTTNEDRLDQLATKYEDDYVVAGIVDGEFTMAYWRRS